MQALGKEAGKAEIPWEVRPSAIIVWEVLELTNTLELFILRNQYEPIIIKGYLLQGRLWEVIWC